MIKSKEELRRIANGVATQIKNDMRSKIINFMEQMGASETELASVLDINVRDLERILSGDGEITLTTFAKLVVASEHTIEIKQLPINHAMPNRNRNARPSMHAERGNRNGNIPSYEEFQRMVNAGEIPPPPRGFMGCGMPRRNTMPTTNVFHSQELNNNDSARLDSMTRRDLVNTIVNNDWDNEIDLVNATRSDLIDFLMSKDFHTEERHEEIKMPRQSDKVNKMANALADAISKNPQLASMLEKFIN